MKQVSLLQIALLAVCFTCASKARVDISELNRQVEQLYDQGKYAEAIRVAEQALAEAEVTVGPDHASTATTLNNLAVFYRDMGRYDEALPLHKLALANRE